MWRIIRIRFAREHCSRSMFARTGECYAPDASPAPPFHTTGTQRQVPHSLAGVGAGPCVPRGLPKEGRASVKPHCPFDACWRLSVGGSSVKINPCIDMSFPVAPTLQPKGWGFFFLAGRVPEGPSTGQNGPITTLLRPIILNFNRLSGRKTRGARSYSILLSRNPRY